MSDDQEHVQTQGLPMAGRGNGNGKAHLEEAERAFVERWHDNAYGCYSSGHKFCREVCPVMQVTRNENHTPTAASSTTSTATPSSTSARASR